MLACDALVTTCSYPLERNSFEEQCSKTTEAFRFERGMPEALATDLRARGNHDNQKGEEAMEKRDPFVLETHEVPVVAEAIEAWVSLLQTLPPSEWRDRRLKLLNSLVKKLAQLMEETQLEQAVWVGMD
jgi:hypothetical protein